MLMIKWFKSVLGIQPVVQKSTPKKVAGGPSGKSAAKVSANVASKKITKAGGKTN